MKRKDIFDIPSDDDEDTQVAPHKRPRATEAVTPKAPQARIPLTPKDANVTRRLKCKPGRAAKTAETAKSAGAKPAQATLPQPQPPKSSRIPVRVRPQRDIRSYLRPRAHTPLLDQLEECDTAEEAEEAAEAAEEEKFWQQQKLKRQRRKRGGGNDEINDQEGGGSSKSNNQNSSGQYHTPPQRIRHAGTTPRFAAENVVSLQLKPFAPGLGIGMRYLPDEISDHDWSANWSDSDSNMDFSRCSTSTPNKAIDRQTSFGQYHPVSSPASSPSRTKSRKS